MKTINIFKKGKNKINATNCWIVRWDQVIGAFSGYYKYNRVAEFFTSKEDAERFKNTIEMAAKQLGDKCRWISIEKSKYTGI